MQPLPIDAALPELRAALASASKVILQAHPGAGKSTVVPLALMNEPWLRGRIIMLEPRRLAARAIAHRMAATLRQNVGRLVGYRMRMGTRAGPQTRIEVVTEGVMTRMLQSDPGLDGVSLLIFDEFHERSLQADLALALSLQAQSLLRDDLRLLVMSATLDDVRITALLGDAPVIRSPGRIFPVETRYVERRRSERVEPLVAATIRQSLREDRGDVLVFLPGASEIRRVDAILRKDPLPANVAVLHLHGMLSYDTQLSAIDPSADGCRKVVLATSIAETGLTIDGVRVVIDSGLQRRPRFSPQSGMTRLETTMVSRSSADQRRGRGGRTAPGICYRLWREGEHLLPHIRPEIVDADLAPLALELAAWGSDVSEWLDPPPEAHLAQGRMLLRQLGALDDENRITLHGYRMVGLPVHPRLAHMMLRSRDAGEGPLACDLAALLSERDMLRRGPPNPDIRLRLVIMRSESILAEDGVDRQQLGQIREQSRRLRELLGCAIGDSVGTDDCGRLLALAYPDRVAICRSPPDGRFLMRNGRPLVIDPSQPLATAPFVVAAETDGVEGGSRLFLGAPMTMEDVESLFGEDIVRDEVIMWDGGAGAVRARRRRLLGAIVLEEAALLDPDPERIRAALLDGVRKEGLAILPWSKRGLTTRDRMLFMHGIEPAEWPNVTDTGLIETLEVWLAPWLDGMKYRSDLYRLDLSEALLGLLDWRRRVRLDFDAPSGIRVPSGSLVGIDYSDPCAPAVAVRLQEVFGMAQTPRIAGGNVPLVMRLLSPAGRPAQVTGDLASFWREGYYQVRKELRGRYPKHYWPDDPLVAEPRRGARSGRPKRSP